MDDDGIIAIILMAVVFIIVIVMVSAFHGSYTQELGNVICENKFGQNYVYQGYRDIGGSGKYIDEIICKKSRKINEKTIEIG